MENRYRFRAKVRKWTHIVAKVSRVRLTIRKMMIKVPSPPSTSETMPRSSQSTLPPPLNPLSSKQSRVTTQVATTPMTFQRFSVTNLESSMMRDLQVVTEPCAFKSPRSPMVKELTPASNYQMTTK